MGETLNIFLPPLLGGFLFIILSKIFRHRVLRHDGQYLFFLSASFGLLFLIPSYLITRFLAYNWPELANLWKWLFPFSYSATSFGAIILALMFSFLFSFMPRDKVIGYIINDEGDAIEKMLWEALRKALMICVTLDNGKVYVGFVSNPFESGFKRLKSISIVPTVSGYRDDKTKSLNFTNYYEEITEDAKANSDKYTVNKNNVSISLPLTKIISINYFDPAIYRQFNEEIEEELVS